MPRTTVKRSATVADVAALAGVSKAQAARALGAYGQVSEKVRVKVQDAADELGFRPNHLAKTMSTGRSNILGVVVGDIENPYFGEAVRGITDVARESGFTVMLLNSDEKLDAEVEAVEVLARKRVDGILVAPCSAGSATHLSEVNDSGTPLVQFDRKAADLESPSIMVDFRDAAEAGVNAMLDAGHRRIAYISSLDIPGDYAGPSTIEGTAIAQRVEGIVDTFAQRGLTYDTGLIRFRASSASIVEDYVDDLLDQAHVTGFIASDSIIGEQILTRTRQRGLTMFEDFSFLMYDDPPWTRLITPSISVITQPVYETGARAAKALISKIKGETVDSLQPLSATFVPRESIAAVS